MTNRKIHKIKLLFRVQELTSVRTTYILIQTLFLVFGRNCVFLVQNHIVIIHDQKISNKTMYCYLLKKHLLCFFFILTVPLVKSKILI